MAEHAITGQDTIEIEVACALPDRQWVKKLCLPSDSTVEQAIEASGVLSQFPAHGPGQGAVGIFGRVVPLTQKLNAGDRVEIYRPLLADPKQMRRVRARKTRDR